MKALDRTPSGIGATTTARLTSLGIIALPLLTVLGWGGSFPVAKVALPSLNAFYLSTMRYALASLIFAALLWAVEGTAALRLEGRWGHIFVLGSTGFAGFGLLAFVGLTHTRPQNAALLVATMPLLTALVLWVRRGIRPMRSTMAFMFIALTGVGLVITRGHPSLLFNGQVGAGDVMVLAGVLCWVVYMLGASSFPGWSPLRYTTLTTLAGTATIVVITAMATMQGYITAPSFHSIGGMTWEIAYMVLPGTVVAVLTWNAAIKRLGPQNTVLFINLVPIITLAIELSRGYQVAGIELAGGGITILALIGDNLWQRHTQARRNISPAVDSKVAAA